MARLPDAPMPAAMPAGRVAPGLEAGVQAAIDALRGSLESRMDGLLWSTREGPGREPVGAGLFRALLEAGFSMPLARILLERLPQALDATQALAWARNELVTHLPVLRREDDLLAGGGVFALVGPTGVGKTTTLAKLAARCVAREGREQVAMLTTDNFRIGALEQLQIYGRLMGIPAHSVRDADELRDALGSLGNRRIILIDTTGISQRDRQVAGQAAMLCNAGKPVRRLLVLNAASQGDTLDEVAHAYRNGVGEDVVGCIITKLDEASRLAPALDTAIRHRLPIHYVSYGQKVPEHMALARADELIDRTLATLQRVKPLYAPSEADLAALCSASREQARDEPAQRRQMLAATLLGQGGDAARDLDGALDWLRDDPACAQARSDWRAAMAGPATARALGDAGLALARQAYPAVSSRYLLAMHGKAALRAAGLPQATLLSALLMSDRGAALTAPAQQLMLQHGLLAAYAPGEPAGANPMQALLARTDYLSGALAQLPHVHVFDAGSAPPWQALAGQDAGWLARCAGATRVQQDLCPTLLRAVARGLGYLPVGNVTVPGKGGAPLALWAGSADVSLAARGQAPLAVRMVSARLLDPSSGRQVAQWFGLTNLAAMQADAGTLARWLVQYEQARGAFRYMAHAWAALPPDAGDAAALAARAGGGTAGRGVLAAGTPGAGRRDAPGLARPAGAGRAQDARAAGARGLDEVVCLAGDGRLKAGRAGSGGDDGAARCRAGVAALAAALGVVGGGRAGAGGLAQGVERLLRMAQVHRDQGAVALVVLARLGGVGLQGLPQRTQFRVGGGGRVGAGRTAGQAGAAQQGVALGTQLRQVVGQGFLALHRGLQRLVRAAVHQGLGFRLQGVEKLHHQGVFAFEAGLQGGRIHGGRQPVYLSKSRALAIRLSAMRVGSIRNWPDAMAARMAATRSTSMSLPPS